MRLQDALNGASAQLDQQMSAYNDIQERVTELQQQLECSEATCEAQADQIKDLQAKLVGKNADAGALQKRIEEQQQQWSAKESEFINLVCMRNSCWCPIALTTTTVCRNIGYVKTSS